MAAVHNLGYMYPLGYHIWFFFCFRVLFYAFFLQKVPFFSKILKTQKLQNFSVVNIFSNLAQLKVSKKNKFTKHDFSKCHTFSTHFCWYLGNYTSYSSIRFFQEWKNTDFILILKNENSCSFKTVNFIKISPLLLNIHFKSELNKGLVNKWTV